MYARGQTKTGSHNMGQNPTQPYADLQSSKLLTLLQVQELLQVSRQTLYSLFESGKLRRRKIGGSVRVALRDLNQFIETGSNDA